MRHQPSASSAADFPRNVKMELPNQARRSYGVEFPARAMFPPACQCQYLALAAHLVAPASGRSRHLLPTSHAWRRCLTRRLLRCVAQAVTALTGALPFGAFAKTRRRSNNGYYPPASLRAYPLNRVMWCVIGS